MSSLCQRIALVLLALIALGLPSSFGQGLQGVSVTYSGGLVIGQVGSAASVPAVIGNDSGQVRQFTLTGTALYTTTWWPSKCTATGATPSITAGTLAPGEKMPLTFVTTPQTSPGACIQSWKLTVNGDNTLIAIRQVSQPPGWYNSSTGFENDQSFDTIDFGGTKFESQPSETCAVGSTSQYGSFRYFGGNAIVCWGESLTITFGGGIRHAGFHCAGPSSKAFRDFGMTVMTTFAFPDGTTTDLLTRPGLPLSAAGNVALPTWLESSVFVTNDVSFYAPGTPANPDVVIRRMKISHPDHQPFIVDNLAVLGPTPAVSTPLSVLWVAPRQAPAGSVIDIQGSAFTSGSGNTNELIPPLVRIGGKPAEVLAMTATTINAVVPPLANGPASIEVVAADGRSSGTTEHLFSVGPIPPRRRAIGH